MIFEDDVNLVDNNTKVLKRKIWTLVRDIGEKLI